MSEHALLSASSAKRWLSCPPSARLEETLPESTSPFAEAGTLAHSIGELKLRKFIEPMSRTTFSKRLNKLKKDTLFTPDMLVNTETYLEFVSKIVHSYSALPYIAIEKKLDYSQYAPEGFGTGDCILICDNDMHVIDYKNGQGIPVSAENNPQMMLYALGAYKAYGMLYPIKNVHLNIVQPKLGLPSIWTIALEELLAWGESIKPIAQLAFEGKGEFKSGEHCKFCRANATCRARCETNSALEDFGYKLPPLLTIEEVGAVLQKSQDLAAWAKSLETYALAETLKGVIVPGWKAVAGKGSRSFTDIDKAFDHLIKEGTPKAMLYENKPLTAAKVQELLGFTQYNKLLVEAGFIIKQQGKPTLVAVSDPRESYHDNTAAEDFKTPINEVPVISDTSLAIPLQDQAEAERKAMNKAIIEGTAGPLLVTGPQPEIIAARLAEQTKTLEDRREAARKVALESIGRINTLPVSTGPSEAVKRVLAGLK